MIVWFYSGPNIKSGEKLQFQQISCESKVLKIKSIF